MVKISPFIFSICVMNWIHPATGIFQSIFCSFFAQNRVGNMSALREKGEKSISKTSTQIVIKTEYENEANHSPKH